MAQLSKRARRRQRIHADKLAFVRLPECRTGKRRYKTEGQAAQALEARRENAQDGGPVRVYPCNLCRGGWHLTSKELRADG